MSAVENRSFIQVGKRYIVSVVEHNKYYRVIWLTKTTDDAIFSALRRFHQVVTEDSTIPNDGTTRKVVSDSVMLFQASGVGRQAPLEDFLDESRFSRLLEETKGRVLVRVNTVHGDFLYGTEEGLSKKTLSVATHLDLSRYIVPLILKTHKEVIPKRFEVMMVQKLRDVCIRNNIPTVGFPTG